MSFSRLFNLLIIYGVAFIGQQQSVIAGFYPPSPTPELTPVPTPAPTHPSTPVLSSPPPVPPRTGSSDADNGSQVSTNGNNNNININVQNTGSSGVTINSTNECNGCNTNSLTISNSNVNVATYSIIGNSTLDPNNNTPVPTNIPVPTTASPVSTHTPVSTKPPTNAPTNQPTTTTTTTTPTTKAPTASPTNAPIMTSNPTTKAPTASPTNAPTNASTASPTNASTNASTASPTNVVCVTEGGHCVPDNHLTTAGGHNSCCESLRCHHGICSTGGNDTLVDIPTTLIKNGGTFSTLVAALDQTDDLIADLSSPYGPYTVFGPTNAAFEALPTGLLPCLLEEQNKPVLTAILCYHLAKGEVLSQDLTNGLEIPTLYGQTVVVGVNNNNGTVLINDATVSGADIQASNGVIHAIDAVLVPSTIDVTAFLATCVVVPTTPDPTTAPTLADITKEECAILTDKATGYSWCQLTSTCLAPGDDACKEAVCEENSGSTGYSWCKLTGTCVAPGNDACKNAACEQNSGSTGYSWCAFTRSCIPPTATCEPTKRGSGPTVSGGLRGGSSSHSNNAYNPWPLLP